jgi:hypothetical protein
MRDVPIELPLPDVVSETGVGGGVNAYNSDEDSLARSSRRVRFDDVRSRFVGKGEVECFLLFTNIDRL